MNDTNQSTEDLAILEQLNRDYVHSDQFNNVKRFSEFLAQDFIVQTPGVTRNREEFLDYIAKPRPFKDLAVHDVNIRVLSDVALIHARATHTTLADGVDQEALYTDTYQKREGTGRREDPHCRATDCRTCRGRCWSGDGAGGPALNPDGVGGDVVDAADHGQFCDCAMHGPGTSTFGKRVVGDGGEGVAAAGGSIRIQHRSGIDGAQPYPIVMDVHQGGGIDRDDLVLGVSVAASRQQRVES